MAEMMNLFIVMGLGLRSLSQKLEFRALRDYPASPDRPFIFSQMLLEP